MVTWHYSKKLYDPVSGTYSWYREGACLSADDKPISTEDWDISNGSKLEEIDTAKIYLYDAAGGTWVEWGV